MSEPENKNRGQYEKFCEGKGAADFAKGFLAPHFPDAEYMIHPLAMALRLSDSGEYYVMDEDLFERREKPE
jgi:hypothetical protein